MTESQLKWEKSASGHSISVDPDQLVVKTSSLALLRAKPAHSPSKNTGTIQVSGTPATSSMTPWTPLTDSAASGTTGTAKNMVQSWTGSLGDESMMSSARRIMNFLYTMWQQEKLCDVGLHTADRIFYAHRVVMAAYSDRLMVAFQERQKGHTINIAVLDLRDMTYEHMVTLVSFLYTTDIELNDSNVGDILAASIRLDIQIIVDICIDYLSRYNLENSLLYYTICQRCDITMLAINIWRFICENFEAISRTRGFMTANLHIVLALLSEDCIKVSNEYLVFDAAARWLDYDWESRMRSAGEVLTCVRVPLVQPVDIITKIETDQHLLDLPDSARKLYHAMCYHALKATGNSLASKFASRERTGPTGGITAFPRTVEALSMDMKLIETMPEVQAMRQIGIKPEFLQPMRQVSIKPEFPSRMKQVSIKPEPFPPKGPMSMKSDLTEVYAVGAPTVTSSRGNIYVIGGVDVERLGEEKPGMCVTTYSHDLAAWRLLTYLPVYTHHHAAVTVAGKIYVIGGSVFDPLYPDDLGTATNQVFIYDPMSTTWANAAPMNDCRSYHGAVVFDDMIYVIGGENENKIFLETIERYDPASDTWTAVGHLPGGGRIGAAVAMCRHLLYVVGGYNRSLTYPIMDDVLCCDLRTMSWQPCRALFTPRCHASLACVDGQLYLIGGRTKLLDQSAKLMLNGIISLDSVLRLDEASGEWITETTMESPRHDTAVTVSGNKVLVIGGMCTPNSFCLSTVECYDVAQRCWVKDFPELPYPTTGSACVAMNPY